LRGVTQDQLKKKPFGHELQELLGKAIEKGLEISQSARSKIEMLDEAHTEHWPRYPREDAKPVFIISHFEPYVEELFDAVRLKVRGPSPP